MSLFDPASYAARGADPAIERHARLLATRLARPLADGAARIVDVGCGTGALLAALGPTAATQIGIEPDDSLAAVARAQGLDVCAGRAEALPLPESSADVLVYRLCWHLVADPAAALAEARRVLRPHGALVIFTFEQQGVAEQWMAPLMPGYLPLEWRRFADTPRLHAMLAAAAFSVEHSVQVRETQVLDRERALHQLRQRAFSILRLLPAAEVDAAAEIVAAGHGPIESVLTWREMFATRASRAV